MTKSITGLNQVLGSLTLGGYDKSKFEAHDMTWSFDSYDIRDLTVQITAITSSESKGETPLLSQATPAFLDSGLPYLWLPEESCTSFEKAFNLTYDKERNMYPLTDEQHKALLTRNPNITFTLGNLTAGFSTNISLPYAAFDLTATAPIFPNSTRYFPLKRAANTTQVTLGRTFFQEAYVIADYDRANFSVSQCKWVADAPEAIVPILAPTPVGESTSGADPESSGTANNDGNKNKTTAIGPIVGGVVGGLVAIAVVAYLIYRFCVKPRRHAAEAATAAALAANAEKEDPQPPPPDEDPAFFKPELAAVSPVPVSEVDGGKNTWHAEADGVPLHVHELPAEEVAIELRGEGGVPEVMGSTQHPSKRFSWMQTPIEMSRNPNARWSWITSPGAETLQGSEMGSFRETDPESGSPESASSTISPQSARTPRNDLRDAIVSPQSGTKPQTGGRRF